MCVHINFHTFCLVSLPGIFNFMRFSNQFVVFYFWKWFTNLTSDHDHSGHSFPTRSPPLCIPLWQQFPRCRCQSAWQSGYVSRLVSSPPRNLKQTRCGLRAAKWPYLLPHAPCPSPLWWHEKPRLSLGFCCCGVCAGQGDIANCVSLLVSGRVQLVLLPAVN